MHDRNQKEEKKELCFLKCDSIFAEHQLYTEHGAPVKMQAA